MLYRVTEEEAGRRLDAFLSERSGLSRSALARLIDNGEVTVNDRAEKRSYPVAAGDSVLLSPKEPEPATAGPENIPLDIVFEDNDILVVNKPSGMVVHPAPGNESGTLVNALLFHCGDSLSGIGGVLRPGIVHRIDKDTSGLLVVAKNDEAHRGLCAQMEGHHIRREYRALAVGGFASDSGTIDLPIGRHPTDRKRMAVLSADRGKSREAITHYRVLARFGMISYLSLELETGRTHQIRVHLSHLGHPLLGDRVYGGGKTPFERRHAALLSGQALHAAALSFRHPRTGEPLFFTCPLPPEFEKLLRLLEAEAR